MRAPGLRTNVATTEFCRFYRIRFDTQCRDDMLQVMNSLGKKFTLWRLAFKFDTHKLRQILTNNVNQCICIWGWHKHIVEIKHDFDANFKSENALHQSLKPRRRVAQFERHHVVHKVSLVRHKFCLESFFKLYVYLMISHLQIECCDVYCFGERLPDFIDSLQKIGVFSVCAL